MRNIIIFLISSIISCVILFYIANKRCKSPVIIKHKLKPYEWFITHAVIYLLTLLMMLYADIFYCNATRIENMTWGIKGIIYLFIQNGGLIIFVMIGSSWIYNYAVKTIEFNFFIERHLWLKKMFFSIICLTLAILYVVESGKHNDNTNILEGEYKLITIWIIVFVQIWISFGMKLNIPKYSRTDLLEQLKRAENAEALREERKYIFFCMISMIMVSVMMLGLFIIERKIPQLITGIISPIFYGLLIGVLLMILRIVIYASKYHPSRWYSKKKLIRFFIKYN